MSIEMPRIALVGDPHGNFEEIVPRLLALQPEAAIFLGDMHGDSKEVATPLADLLAPVIRADIAVRWIHGNHDADNAAFYAATFGSMGELNISGRVEQIAGLRVAGLGGVFRGKVWHPQMAGGEPVFATREAYLATLPRSHRHAGGLPIRQRASLFCEDFDLLALQRADVLVTHEAPSAYHHPARGIRGFDAFDDLARAMGVQVIVHGHHHHSYACRRPDGILCVGLGLAEVALLDDLLSADERQEPLRRVCRGDAAVPD